MNARVVIRHTFIEVCDEAADEDKPENVFRRTVSDCLNRGLASAGTPVSAAGGLCEELADDRCRADPRCAAWTPSTVSPSPSDRSSCCGGVARSEEYAHGDVVIKNTFVEVVDFATERKFWTRQKAFRRSRTLGDTPQGEWTRPVLHHGGQGGGSPGGHISRTVNPAPSGYSSGSEHTQGSIGDMVIKNTFLELIDPPTEEHRQKALRRSRTLGAAPKVEWTGPALRHGCQSSESPGRQSEVHRCMSPLDVAPVSPVGKLVDDTGGGEKPSTMCSPSKLKVQVGLIGSTPMSNPLSTLDAEAAACDSDSSDDEDDDDDDYRGLEAVNQILSERINQVRLAMLRIGRDAFSESSL